MGLGSVCERKKCRSRAWKLILRTKFRNAYRGRPLLHCKPPPKRDRTKDPPPTGAGHFSLWEPTRAGYNRDYPRQGECVRLGLARHGRV